MTSHHLAALTLDVWRASGLRTEPRRYALLVAYASTYYGEPSTWPATIRELVKTAEQLCKQQTRIDELQYV